jgi:hypothetical protein
MAQYTGSGWVQAAAREQVNLVVDAPASPQEPVVILTTVCRPRYTAYGIRIAERL